MRQLEVERSTESYAKRQAASAQRREKTQTEYVTTFRDAVFEFLAFAPIHAELAARLPTPSRHTPRQLEVGPSRGRNRSLWNVVPKQR